MNRDRMESGPAGRKAYRKPELLMKKIEVGVYGTYAGDGEDPPLAWPGGVHHGDGRISGGRGGRGGGR